MFVGKTQIVVDLNETMTRLNKLADAGVDRAGKKALRESLRKVSSNLKAAAVSDSRYTQTPRSKKYGHRKPGRALAATVGVSVQNTRRKDQQISAKTGFAVGRAKKTGIRAAGSRPGVGISGRNVHWLLLGTKTRSGGSRGAGNRGKLRPMKGLPNRSIGGALGFIDQLTKANVEAEVQILNGS